MADSIIIPIENSVNSLVKNWKRRRKWQLVFGNQEHAADDHNRRNRAPWRVCLGKFMESTPVHIASLILLLIDLVLTVLDISTSLVSCKAKTDEEENEVFHWIGIAILSVLTLKVLVSVVAWGTSFFKRPGNVIDGVVVISALILEFVKENWAGLLVVVSIWRVVRVVESVFELSDEAIEAKIEGIQRQFEDLRNENQSLRDEIAKNSEKIAELEKELDELRFKKIIT
ncbi:hypothetical protein C5167_015142 [Papaver somniferum]|uniref:Voltage-gated hydrogen channel 1 n=1 Tax=Papaver somniferum TaxID=3469 RepID=A0A4Y7J9J6_PAPSO|nr:voltage-gated hydrogen channel 1 [Papaver somniferum]XP_026460797.1 voltage-gated hydrogen channel 1 [Papaver somniferum]RZC56285.1 hypothetical protein C5167_015142 [Papaver somniferum]